PDGATAPRPSSGPRPPVGAGGSEKTGRRISLANPFVAISNVKSCNAKHMANLDGSGLPDAERERLICGRFTGAAGDRHGEAREMSEARCRAAGAWAWPEERREEPGVGELIQ